MIETMISTMIMIPMVFYIWNSWSDKKIKLKDKRTIIMTIIGVMFTLINYFNVNTFIKIVNMTLILIIVYKYLFDVRIKESVVGPLMSQTVYFIGELLFALFMVSILKKDVSDLTTHYIGTFFTNISIALISLFISKVKLCKKLFKKFNIIIYKFDEISVIFVTCLLIFVYTIFAINTYYSLNSDLLLFMTITIAIAAFSLVFMFFKAKDDYYEINDKYNGSLTSLKELEKVLSNQRIDNHENKNHLLTIRNMTKSKKIINFIDSILNNKLKDDKNILHETSIIPEGGLRGLVYAKLLTMSDKHIEYELDISNSIRILDMLQYDDNTMLDICKIVGIFLDNAIEEVETIDDKYIIIEMYIENEVLNIAITNTYNNKIDKRNIYKKGVSTKGEGHGYGLSLVKKIVKRNKKISTHHEIGDDEFTQVLNVRK